MQLNLFNDKPRLQLSKEERIALFEKAKSGNSNAIETFVFSEIEMVEKIILKEQKHDIKHKFTLIELYQHAENIIRYCIDNMQMPIYNQMVALHLILRIRALIIEKNNAD